ncbi:MAG: pitrilysin family protein [bacterium]
MNHNARKAFAASIILTVTAFAASAQERTSPQPDPGQLRKSTVLKNRAPVSKELLKVKLPNAKEATLKNGLRVLVLENHRVPLVSMQMVILSGGLSDPADQRGLASSTASLLREGTAKRSSKEIAEQVDSLGATLSANASVSSFTSAVTTSGLVENLDQLLDIFSDVVRNPKFPADEVEKFKGRTLASLLFLRSNPSYLAQERFNRAIYGNHPAALVNAPPESLRRTTAADLAKFHSTYYRPNNAMLTIVGDVKLKDVLPKIERAFGDWQKGDVSPATIPAVQAQPDARIYLIDRPGSVQTVLQLGNLGIQRTDPDYFPLLIMNKVVGADAASRLFLNLREDHGYTYGAYSSFVSSKFPGTWLANSSVRTEVTEGAMREFMYELKRIRSVAVETAELENAKRALIGSFALSLEDPQALLQNIVTQRLYDLPKGYWDTYPQKVAAVTAADVQRVAQKYVDLDHLQIVAVGDAAKTRAILNKYGTVEVYDADGKPVTGGEN